MLKKVIIEEKVILRRVLVYSERISRDWYIRLDLIFIGVEGANII